MDSDDLDLRRRRCLFRAEHRGTKEMDWLLGKFAAATLPGVDAGELAFWEEFVLIADPQLYDWIMGAQPAADKPVAHAVEAIRTFHGMTGIEGE